eukprot:CAMPEP_0174834196 /NCGR_PEP_ID=MMETSP1114-20130205/4682_1 /TAXON_ID=312471 /ORGANISM="Neobodo designis, Strain CCAP 1951/1" /LENGTH=129 /DNA_ID=CAMNT_0016068101 /DNA_START=97 /DNA_END=487 /DNA_ORIENTATION=-
MSAEDAMQFGDVLPTPYVHAYPTDASRAGYNGSVSPGGNPARGGNLENILGSLSRGVAVDEKTVFDAYVLLSCTYRHHVRNSNNVLANMWAAHTRPNDAAVAAVTDQSMLLPGAVKPKAIAGKNINESA